VVADVCSDADDEATCALDLSRRLVPDDEAEHVMTLIGDAHLLRSGAGKPDELERSEILQLATHLASASHARDAHALALAIGPLPRWHREALDERLRLVTEALEHPEVTGSEANNLAAARRAAAERLLDEPAAVERLRFASNGYLLSHEPDELARHARLIEPLPRAGVVRVAVAAGPNEHHWTIDVACRDTDALLARLTTVLTEFGLDIAGAKVATWPDGAVLDSFVVRAPHRPPAKELALAMEAALIGRLSSPAMPGLDIQFDNDSLPWHTAVTVTGDDRPGLLHAVSTAFAAADMVVHTARIATTDGQANDRFAVTDRVGRKVTTDQVERMTAALAKGGRPRRSLARR
jgi:UTP:GlnB (protein PII) uridylyltransferase